MQEEDWFAELDTKFKHMAIDIWIGKKTDDEGWWEED